MIARSHPLWGDWLCVDPKDSRRIMERLLRERDKQLEQDKEASGMPPGFAQWCREEWLPGHIQRDFYRRQAEERIKDLGPKIERLADDAERLIVTVIAERDRLIAERELLHKALYTTEVETNVDS